MKTMKKNLAASIRSIRMKALFGCTLIWFTAMLSTAVQAQRFIEEINAFKKADSVAMPAPGQILLLGSSSFTLWKNVGEYFPGYAFLNRAFGGSTLQDLWNYREQLIPPYKPRQIIIYCGENDFAVSDTISVNTVVNRFIQLFTYIRTVYPKIPVAYVSLKPSPSKRHLLARYQQANALIQQWLRKQRNASFIDVYSAMVQPDGQPMPHLFLSDSLHMNADGYRIWQGVMKPYLKK